MIANNVDVFSDHQQRREASRDAEIQELRAKVGELVIEKDFLSKASTVEGLIDSNHSELKQCGLVSISRSTSLPRGEFDELMRSDRQAISGNHVQSRQIALAGLRRQSEAGASSDRKMGLQALPEHVGSAPGAPGYPYLLRDRAVRTRPGAPTCHSAAPRLPVPEWRSRIGPAGRCCRGACPTRWMPPVWRPSRKPSRSTDRQRSQHRPRQPVHQPGVPQRSILDGRQGPLNVFIDKYADLPTSAGPASAGGSTSTMSDRTVARARLTRIWEVRRPAAQSIRNMNLNPP